MSEILSRTLADADTSTKRLAFNAAFLRDIKADNRDLKILVERLRLLTDPRATAVNHWGELVGLWTDLCDQLAMHFGLEEAYGYFDQAIGANLELSIVAESLRAQHAPLFEAARYLAEAAAEAALHSPRNVTEGAEPEITPAQDRVLDRWQRWWFEFQQHEEAELKVILDALDEDLGVGD